MLNKIIEVKKTEVEQLYQSGYEYNLSVSERTIPSFSFVKALQNPKRSSALIAEVKKASPSKGVIREDFQPVQIADEYERGGADCLSVLTDRSFFQGHESYIQAIKERVSLPILRKDFIIDPIQVYQSVELGADAILLIAKALPTDKLVELYELAAKVGLDVLIEVANREEVENVLAHVTPSIIGINNRDLSTFTTSTEVTKSLLTSIPEEVLVISESGIHSAETVRDLERHGVRGFLIGEHFMRQEKIKEAVEALYVQA
ncbi:indole-3-glycerol phosphate synthase TrpC [Caldalkalibacillus mannanilyticus]|uniref:indole-3-glycerol phosphate synthase TrpC n=1 Tax=Caldalkalibacillus mannanilyticus TaxID=1418 RepID=UPI00046818CC|nr:indole-3-glycerol phosphate synthase TrpC [Caldalkalibacillus mannanilyticus]